MTASDLAFLDLRPLERDGRYALAVTPRICTPFAFLYGGAAMAACVAAAEHHAGWPVSWATVQYVANAFPDEVLDLEVLVPARGRATAQVEVVGRVGDRRIVTALLAVTDRPMGSPSSWHEMPRVEPPASSAPWAIPFDATLGTSIKDQLLHRVTARVDGDVDPSRFLSWTRVEGWDGSSAARLGYMADIVPSVVSTALGVDMGGTSLDNTVRVVDPEPGPGGWVLLDVHAQAHSRGIGHGDLRLWSEDGRLLALAQQTCIVRTSHHDRPPPAARTGPA